VVRHHSRGAVRGADRGKSTVVVEFQLRDGDDAAFHRLWLAWLKALSEAGLEHNLECPAISPLSLQAFCHLSDASKADSFASYALPPAPADGGIGLVTPGGWGSMEPSSPALSPAPSTGGGGDDGSGASAMESFLVGARPLCDLARSEDPRARRDGARGLARLATSEDACYPLVVFANALPHLLALLSKSGGEEPRDVGGAYAAKSDPQTALFALTALANISAVEPCQEALVACGAVPVLCRFALSVVDEGKEECEKKSQDARLEAFRALVNLDQGVPERVRGVLRNCTTFAQSLKLAKASGNSDILAICDRLSECASC
jgi:hypothetical protein